LATGGWHARASRGIAQVLRSLRLPLVRIPASIRRRRVTYLGQLLMWLPMFILGSVWYIAITILLYMIWKELRLIRLK
jgi:hypothetical protein